MAYPGLTSDPGQEMPMVHRGVRDSWSRRDFMADEPFTFLYRTLRRPPVKIVSPSPPLSTIFRKSPLGGL